MPFTPCIQNQQNSFQTIEKPHIHRGLCTFLENFYQIFFDPSIPYWIPLIFFVQRGLFPPSFRHKNPANCKEKERTHRISPPMNKFTVYFFSIPFFSKIQKNRWTDNFSSKNFPLSLIFSSISAAGFTRSPSNVPISVDVAITSRAYPPSGLGTLDIRNGPSPPSSKTLSKRGFKSAIPFFHHLKIHLPIPYYNQYFSIIL